MSEIKTFDVTIKTAITKTFRVEAADEDAACDTAHERCSALHRYASEDYVQEVEDIEEVEGA